MNDRFARPRFGKVKLDTIDETEHSGCDDPNIQKWELPTAYSA